MAKRSSKARAKAAPDSPARAQAAKAELSARYADSDWCRGIGIAPDEQGGLALRINVAPGALVEGLKLPKEVGGFPLQVVAIAGYEKRATRAAPEPKGRSSKKPSAEPKAAPKRPAGSGASKAAPARKSRGKPGPRD
jgi:hypothetical protein